MNSETIEQAVQQELGAVLVTLKATVAEMNSELKELKTTVAQIQTTLNILTDLLVKLNLVPKSSTE